MNSGSHSSVTQSYCPGLKVYPGAPLATAFLLFLEVKAELKYPDPMMFHLKASVHGLLTLVLGCVEADHNSREPLAHQRYPLHGS